MAFSSSRTAAAFVAMVALPPVLAAQHVARVTVTPSPARVVAGDSLRLKAVALDQDGKPMSGVLLRFQQADFPFQGTVDSTGLVMAGSVSTIPVVGSAIHAG